jgi:hypothetical protein
MQLLIPMLIITILSQLKESDVKVNGEKEKKQE